MVTSSCACFPAHIIVSFFLLSLLSPVSCCLAAEGGEYRQDLLKKAQRLDLWQSPDWHALLHMGRAGSSESRIDSPEFFLSPVGSRNPTAEGVATLNGFFQPLEPDREDRHPQCLYPARYRFLKEHLSFDRDFLFEQPCPQLTQWITAMDPDGLSLVFPESYLNNPASMFGHTLLRIEQDAARSPLLAPSINFAAVTDDKPGIAYAFKGLFGGYAGKFSVGLYVDQVRAYGALENRDIYEYRLGLSAAETRFLLLHVWELRRASFDYFFIDENCSYQLLALLEVARPSFDFTGKMQSVAVPVETIRRVRAVPGLLKEVHYRPSTRTVLQQKTKDFSRDQKLMVQVLAETGRLPDEMQWNSRDPVEQAKILEAAIELFLYNQAVARGVHDADAPVLNDLLTARSRLDVEVQLQSIPIPPVRPDQGHSASRAGFGMGVDDGDFFVQFGFRPVLHDLMDPGPGYVDGAQIDFFSTVLRYLPEQEQLKVQAIDLLHIVSLPSGDELVNPISWTARVAMNQMRYTDGEDRLTGKATTGFGVSGWMSDDFQMYSLIASELLVSDGFKYGWNAGLGPIVGLRSGFDRWNFIVQAQAGYFFLHQTDWSWSLQFVQAVNITSDFSLRLRVSREQEFAGPATETVFSLFWYF